MDGLLENKVAAVAGGASDNGRALAGASAGLRRAWRGNAASAVCLVRKMAGYVNGESLVVGGG